MTDYVQKESVPSHGKRLQAPRTRHLFWCLFLLFPLAMTMCEGQALAGSPAQPSLYLGVNVPGWLQNLSAVTSFEQQAHKSVSIVMWYQGWGLRDGTQYFEKSWMNNVRNHGSIPMVTWEPWLYTQGPNQPQYSLRNIISGRFDAYITKWAQASKAWGHPYFLRFAHEMNGNWYPWSEQINGNTAGQYVQAWQHVHDIFTRVGATNVSWVWSPNTENAVSTPLQELYPGPSYVDWVGMDGYNWGGVNGNGWQSFNQIFQQTYTDLTALAPNTPLMIAETASAESNGNKANWITDAFTVQLPTYFPQVKAVIWFDQNKETDWRINSSLESQTAFIDAVSLPMFASNIFKSVTGNIIPLFGK